MATPSPYNIPCPLDCLPFQAKQKIAIIIDGNYNAYRFLASKLKFDAEADAFWNRGLGGPGNSATLLLLREFEQSGGTVQYLYWALDQMNSSAANVVRDFIPYAFEEYQRRTQIRLNSGSGQQNSCRCQSCTRHRPAFNHSISSPQPSIDNPRPSQPRMQLSQPREFQTSDLQTQFDNANVSHEPRSNQNRPINTRNSRTNHDSASNHYQETIRNDADADIHSQRGASNTICNCETCRLRSDPNETQLLTTYTDDKIECVRSQVESVQLNSASGIPIIDRNVKKKPDGEVTPNDNKKVCSKSHIGVHYIGDMPSFCEVCSLYKSGRNSWNGKSNKIERSRNSNSDSHLSCPESHEVIYRRENLDSLRGIGSNTNDLDRQQNIPISNSANVSGFGNATGAANQGQNYLNSRVSSTPSGDREEDAESTEQISVDADNRPIVFITYSKHDHRHMVEIKEMVKKLCEAGIRVKIDMHPDCFDELGVNRNEWLDQSVGRARYVIICISPTYKEDVNGEQNPDNPSPQISQLNARYIYDRLRTEYINNQSQNRRMIPLLFPNSGAAYETHVPQMMQATLVYTYQAHVQMIIDRILGQDNRLPY